ncbi:hypothetical protein PHLH7_63170 [Pseudomonas sp. Ost2]|nr:hypothetical protein PHLH7_63170 [Pseudomonas sp. Ost2]
MQPHCTLSVGAGLLAIQATRSDSKTAVISSLASQLPQGRRRMQPHCTPSAGAGLLAIQATRSDSETAVTSSLASQLLQGRRHMHADCTPSVGAGLLAIQATRSDSKTALTSSLASQLLQAIQAAEDEYQAFFFFGLRYLVRPWNQITRAGFPLIWIDLS